MSQNDVLDRVANALEKVNASLDAMDRRIAALEKDSADEAAYAEIMAGRVEDIDTSLMNLDRKVGKLVDIALDERLDRLEAMLSNYIEATQASRRETAKLHSEVREKLKVSASG